MKKVLVFCPAPRDERELAHARLPSIYQVIVHRDSSIFFDARLHDKKAPTFAVHDYLQCTADFLSRQAIDGIFSSGDYPGSAFAALLAHQLGLPGPDPVAVLRSQHKYLSRCMQYVCAPDFVSMYALADPTKDTVCPLPFPCFIKPVKFAFSIYATRIDSEVDFRKALHTSHPPKAYTQSFNDLLAMYVPEAPHVNQLIVEELLMGQQITYEGFVYRGQVVDLGVTDSLFFNNTLSFSFFRYPSTLPKRVKKRVCDGAARCALGMGLNNTFFNIEFMYNPENGRLSIIEVNARMASQFADLYQKVDGTNSYAAAVALAVGDEPTWQRGCGQFAVAASCVLRVADDHVIEQVPTPVDLERVHELYPEVRLELYPRVGQKLSDLFQDGKTFRYGLVHLGGQSWQEILDKFEHCKQLLPFKLRPC